MLPIVMRSLSRNSELTRRCFTLRSAEPPITDPIADYLAMNVPDRIANVGRLLVIKKVEST